MSESVGPFCNFAQTVLSPDNGAAIILDMVEYERERKYYIYSWICFIIFQAAKWVRSKTITQMLGNF